MKKWLVLAVGFFVISVGLMFASEAKAPSVAFTLATSAGATSSGSPGISFRLAGTPVAPTAGAGPWGAGVIEDPDYPYCTAIGWQALYSNTASSSSDEGYYNTATGYQALWANTTGKHNTANGWQALFSNINSIENTAIGFGALRFHSHGNHNTAVGSQALMDNNGWMNTALGNGAGMDCLDGNHNIFIGGDVFGHADDTNTIRIGSKYEMNWAGAWVGQNQTFIAGIVENPISSGLTPSIVGITSDGRLGTVAAESLPPGPEGPQGPPGPPGLPGEGLISGALLFLATGFEPPAGYTLLGTTEIVLGAKKPTKLMVYIYQKQ